MSTKPTRSRLNPQIRRELMLDAAARIVSNEGVSAVSMDRLREEAGVSKALAYVYFRNRTALLAALLLREYPAFQSTEPLPVDPERSLEEIVRETTAVYLAHVAEKGILLQRLLNEPSVVAAVAETHAVGRDVTARYFGAQMASDRGIPLETAVVAATILMGVTAAAGRLLFEGAQDRDAISDLTTRIIMAGVSEAERRAKTAA